MNSPKISIITVCFNAEKTIRRTIESVVNQSYKNIEYIMVDGQSEDDTVSIIKGFENHISKLVSEKDKGIYDAMNKGIDLATGTYLLFLNADDYLISETAVENIVNQINQHADKEIYYGNLVVYDHTSGRGKIWQPDEVSGKLLFNSTLPHPATLYRRSVFEKLGKFDATYKIAADYEFYVRAYAKSAKFQKINMLIAVFSANGVSCSEKYKELTKVERSRTITTHFSSFKQLYLRFRVRIKKLFNI